jgi:hypothetical protein
VITSTATAGLLLLQDVDAQVNGKINKTGSCPFILDGVYRDATVDVLDGIKAAAPTSFNQIETVLIEGSNGITVGNTTTRTKVLSSVPASSLGVAGDEANMVAYDADYMYVCTASYDGSTNIWKRVALDATAF